MFHPLRMLAPPLRLGQSAICAAMIAGLAAAMPAQPAHAQQTQDLFKRAGNFLQNCDARADEAGTRPDPNYMCLSFVAGMIEGYNYAAVANGNPQPYCLVRPTSLVELMDMMATVIERGVPADMPTAALFHFIMDVNFSCPDANADGAAAAGEDSAQAAPDAAQ